MFIFILNRIIRIEVKSHPQDKPEATRSVDSIRYFHQSSSNFSPVKSNVAK